MQKEASANREYDGDRVESQLPNSATLRLFSYIFTMLKFLYKYAQFEQSLFKLLT